MKCLHIFLAAALLPFALRAQPDPVPASNDTAILLQSKILNQPRTVWVHVPPSHASTDQHYPVLYVLDGDTHFKYASELVDFLSSYVDDRRLHQQPRLYLASPPQPRRRHRSLSPQRRSPSQFVQCLR